MILAITNANIILEDGIIENGTVLIKDGIIEKIGTKQDVALPEEAKIYDACGAYAGPGFVDIHVHGSENRYLYSKPEETARFFLSHGETTVLAAFYYNQSKEEFIKYIRLLRSSMRNGSVPNLVGYYMEGPYMNPSYGASSEKNKWRGEIHRDDYMDILNEAGEDVKIWVIAPEREGIEGFVQDAKQINPNVKFSVGHSEATPEQVFALKQYGIVGLTHAMNATGRLPTLNGTRSCGPDEACFMDDDMYAEMISDSLGIHVHADMQRLLLKIKGADKVVLISDSNVSDEPTPENLAHVTDLLFDANGQLNGSKLTLDVALKNIIKHTGVSLTDAFKMAATNPAKEIGVYDSVGSIAEGKKANIVIMNKELTLQDVFFEGRIVERNVKC